MKTIKVVGASNIQAEMGNGGTHIMFGSTSGVKGKATVYVTGYDGYKGYLNVTTESIH
ncbi:hypothetical protein [Paenibacillus hamazuiensis]|uniref:hypothetical protein n=1 Tax=Paenibacillus hamazuiensis TaxID=2936508 RepID=UPI00200F8BFD|nr:hypothetical protein [Paenibacillus hamazuiensis]